MEHPLKTLWEKPSRLVIGFMSGTSADGVDAALVRITGFGTQTRAEQLGFRFVPFSDEVRAEILRLAGGGPASAADFCRMNFLLGELFCEAGETLCAQTGTKLSDIDLIGSHGQTFWHIPEKEEYLSRTFTSTFQLGEEAVLAERFGCPVVGNFRVRDVAAGGLGAPLVPYTEFLLYRSETEHTALQNIGGIGNITLLPAGCALSDVTAFDTGPGNMLIDAAIARITNGEKRYDANGAMAASGRVSEALLAQLMRDPYLSRRPPKTTGREHYGAAFVDGIFAAANERKLSDADILATVTDFTAQTIAAAIRDFCAVRPARLIVGGAAAATARSWRISPRRSPTCACSRTRISALTATPRKRSRSRCSQTRRSSPGAATRPAPPARGTARCWGRSRFNQKSTRAPRAAMYPRSPRCARPANGQTGAQG